MKNTPVIWDFGLPEKPCKNAIYFILTGNQVQMYVTSQLGVAYQIGSGGGGSDVELTSPDSSITIIQNGQDFTVKVSQLLQDAIAAAQGTNLTYTPTPSQGTVVSDTGSDAVIPATDNTNAGLFLPSEKTKLALLENIILASLDGSVTITGTYPNIDLSVNFPPSGQVDSIVEGTNITVDNTDPQNPIVNAADTNLSHTASPTGILLESSTGTDTTIPLGTNINAGLIEPGGNTKLQNTSGINTGDQDSIVGISGTKTEFNAALSDGDFVFTSDITDYVKNPMESNLNAGGFSITNIDMIQVATDVSTNNLEATGYVNADNFNGVKITAGTGTPDLTVNGTSVVSGTNTGDQTATTTPNTPSGNIASTTVQAALNELDSEKQGNITLTTTGTSGASTLIGNTLNIPNYTVSSSSTSSRMFKIGAGDVVSFFGDSYTVGTGATSAAFGFSRLLTERMAVVQDLLGYSGSGILKAFNSANSVTSYRPTVKSNTKNIVMVGFNDHIRGGADARELAKIENGYNALFASLFAETAVAANNGSITQTGTWTPLTPGSSYPAKATSLSGQPLSNTTTGNKLTYTLTGTSLIVGYITNDATATGVTFSSFDVIVDGSTLATVNTNDKSLAVSDSFYSNQYAPGAVIFKNLAAGSHTVEIVNKSNNLLYIDYIGTLMAPNNCPDTLVCSIPLINAAGYATQPTHSPSASTSAQADLAIQAAMANFPDYPLVWVDINTGFLSSDVGGDTIHYNNTGHARLANNIMKYVANNSVSPYVSSFNDRLEPVTFFGANYRLVNGTPQQMRTGITSEGIFFDTTAASTLAGLIYHANTAGANTQFLKWTKTGNFGINTGGDPAFRLEVNGTTRFTGDSSFGANIVTDLTLAKTVPKITLNNNVVTISGSLQLAGTNAFARFLFRPETTTKAASIMVSPNGAGAVSGFTSSMYLFNSDYGASTANYAAMLLKTGTGNTSGIDMVSAGTGTLDNFNLMVNGTKYFEMTTSGICSVLVNPLTVQTPTTAGHATRKDYVDNLTNYACVVNNTSTPFTSATLNSTYPNVSVGYRVICPNIGTGTIYTKVTEAGSSDVWHSQTSAVVA